MDYELYKWCDDGAVEFRLHADSRPSEHGAPWIRLGFASSVAANRCASIGAAAS
jgi:hypothetical protein